MTVNPQGSIYLCKTVLENDYKNQLTFDSLANQLTYFNSTIQRTLSDYTYIKKDSVINVGIPIDDIIDCNYLFYKNTGFTTKYYFCFITNMEYINENCTRITFETDVFQTWYFDILYKNSFVEREHVNVDGTNYLVPENLDTGEYITYSQTSSAIGEGTPCIAATYDIFNNTPAGSIINGVFQGVDYYVFDEITGIENNIKTFLQKYASASKSDAITSIFMIPKTMINYSSITWDTIPDTTGKYKKLTGGTTPFTFSNVEVTKDLTKIHNITPKNKKLLTYPYRYYMISNNNGANVIYREEFFNNTNPQLTIFKIYGDITPGCSIKLIPQNYKNVTENIEEGVNAGKFPICSWNTDVYTNWLTQNGVNIGLSILSGVGQIAAGTGIALASGGLGTAVGGGQIVGGISQITSVMADIYNHSLIPPQSEGNTNSGDVTYSLGKNEFTVYEMGITNEYIYKIDNYLSMFGYKINEVKIPNITGRPNWNYVKTIDINLEGNIPQNDLNIIKKMFNSGVTLWHNPTTFLDYSQNNNIIEEGENNE